MASTVHMATIEDDQRHAPGPGSLPLWNESFWFAFYDPRNEIGLSSRLGMHPNKQEGNIYHFITHAGEVVHSLIDVHAPLPPQDRRRLALGGLVIEFEEPRERFHLRYTQGWHGMDLIWEGFSPTYMYPFPPQTTADQVPRHIEHAGVVSGTMTIAGRRFDVECLGHRDHSWGGERDWSKLPRWDYLSGEIGRDFWFNAVQVSLTGIPQPIYLGGLWDGKEVLNLAEVEMAVRTTDGGTRQTGVDLRLTDELGRDHHVIGEEVLAIATAPFGRTRIRDGFTRYRYGDRVGYGILEHGYIEQD